MNDERLVDVSALFGLGMIACLLFGYWIAAAVCAVASILFALAYLELDR